MKEKLFVAVLVFSAASVCSSLPEAVAQAHRLGAGVHYWTAVDDIDVEDIDDSGFSYIFSYQYVPSSLIKIEVDLEIFPEDFGGSSETVLAPQAFALLGSGIYAGIGAGVFVAGGDVSDDPFFVLRAGVDLEIIPGLRLDVNANYQFADFDDISDVGEDLDTDTITLGAVGRIEF